MKEYSVKLVNGGLFNDASTGFLSARTDFITDGVSFVINSTSATDDSTVNWWIAP